MYIPLRDGGGDGESDGESDGAEVGHYSLRPAVWRTPLHWQWRDWRSSVWPFSRHLCQGAGGRGGQFDSQEMYNYMCMT